MPSGERFCVHVQNSTYQNFKAGYRRTLCKETPHLFQLLTERGKWQSIDLKRSKDKFLIDIANGDLKEGLNEIL